MASQTESSPAADEVVNTLPPEHAGHSGPFLLRLTPDYTGEKQHGGHSYANLQADLLSIGAWTSCDNNIDVDDSESEAWLYDLTTVEITAAPPAFTEAMQCPTDVDAIKLSVLIFRACESDRAGVFFATKYTYLTATEAREEGSNAAIEGTTEVEAVIDDKKNVA